MGTNSVTVIIHTRNEEQHIKECITSARALTSNILVVDMKSTDKTVDIAESEEVKVVSFPFSHYVEPARAFGIEKAETKWVFILDADERMTTELASELQKIMKSTPLISEDTGSDSPTYYKVPRKNVFGKKKWLKHGGWWPDHQMRFINKLYFKSWPEQIHSTPDIAGKMGYLDNPIIHYFHGDVEKMVQKTMTFEQIESQLLFDAKRPVSTMTFFRKFLGELYRRLIMKAGFLDGPIGIIESLYQAYSKTITYLYLYEKKNSSSV